MSSLPQQAVSPAPAANPVDAAAAARVNPAAVPGDPRPFVLTTRRGPVECAVAGEGPAVLALHGAMGGYDQSVILARAAGAPGFRYVALSRPGYLGTRLATARTPQEQAELYRDVLDALGLREAAVMAVSGGGPSALEFARSYPDRCRGLVVVSSVCSKVDRKLPLAWHLLKLTARLGFMGAAMRRKIARDPDRASSRSIPDPVLRARTLGDPEAGPLLVALQLSTADRMRLRLDGTENDVAITRSDLTIDLEGIRVPVLIVHGTADRAAPFAQGQEMARRIPGAELLAIEGGDHVALFTHREVIHPRVARFLVAHRAG
jgi:pimeloyl-ACP methyl ester carboxylesterase